MLSATINTVQLASNVEPKNGGCVHSKNQPILPSLGWYLPVDDPSPSYMHVSSKIPPFSHQKKRQDRTCFPFQKNKTVSCWEQQKVKNLGHLRTLRTAAKTGQIHSTRKALETRTSKRQLKGLLRLPVWPQNGINRGHAAKMGRAEGYKWYKYGCPGGI